MRAARSLALALLVLGLASGVVTVGCGSESRHPPSISDLQVSSPSLVDPSTLTATAVANLDFRDSGGDLASVTVRSALGTYAYPIAGAEGVTEGTGQLAMTVEPGVYGTLGFEVWLADQAGDESNHLSGSLTFAPDDGLRGWTQVSALPAMALVQAPGTGHARFVAVGAGGLIATSEDGASWVQQESPVTADLRAVAWSGSRFVAAGGDSTIVSSGDGYAWTPEDVPGAAEPLYAVAWGGGAFVAAGGDPVPFAVRSDDGTSWTEATGFELGSPGPIYGLAWGGGRWVATGAWRWASSDGATWSRAPGDALVMAALAVGWNGAQFVAIGSGLGYSADGLTWTEATGLLPCYPAWGLAWSGQHWLALCSDAGAMSADGEAWYAVSAEAPFAGAPVVKILWDGAAYPSRYLAASGAGLWTSR